MAEYVVGRYTLTDQTVTAGGLSVLRGMPCDIELRADGTFTARNVPPGELGSPGPAFVDTLVTGSGTWHIDEIAHGASFETTYWGIRLDSQTAKMHSIGLTGWKPPYGLYYTLGDPDCGYAMILKRSK